MGPFLVILGIFSSDFAWELNLGNNKTLGAQPGKKKAWEQVLWNKTWELSLGNKTLGEQAWEQNLGSKSWGKQNLGNKTW